MPYQDIVMHVDYSAGFQGRIDAATTFAGRQNARLHAVYSIAVDPIYFYAYSDAAIPDNLVEDFHARELDRAEEVRTAFEASVAQKKVKHTWTQEERPDLDLLFDKLFYADLAIIGQPSSDVGYYTSKYFVNTTVIGSGVPVLVIPKGGWPHAIGDRILIGWSEKREATRALNDAMPLLRKAISVDVATVSDDGDNGEADRCCQRLRDNDISADAHHLAAARHEEGGSLLALADKCHSNLIVMGAWGHTRIQEAVLGGVTRTVLNETNRPVLLSH